MLTVRKLADKTGQERVKKFDAATGEPKLVNPATPGEDHEPWPLLGVTFEGDPPVKTTAGVAWVNTAIQEGWLRRVNERPVVRPGGPLANPWAVSHTFIHADRMIFKDHERGFVGYKVIRNPDKYTDDGNPLAEYGSEPEPSEVNWFYVLELDQKDATKLGEALFNG